MKKTTTVSSYNHHLYEDIINVETLKKENDDNDLEINTNCWTECSGISSDITFGWNTYSVCTITLCSSLSLSPISLVTLLFSRLSFTILSVYSISL